MLPSEDIGVLAVDAPRGLEQLVDADQIHDLLSIVLLSLLTLVFFLPALFPNNIFFYLDHGFQNIPFRSFAFSTLKEGIIPLWCPYSAGGFPFFAEGQSGVAYPVNWLFYSVLPFSMAYDYSLILHILFLAVGTYFLFRKFSLTSPAALAGSIGFSFCGYFVRKLMFVNFIQGISFLPWILLCLAPGRSQTRRFSRKRCLTGAFLLGLQCLCGHPQAVMMSVVIVWMFALLSPFGNNRISQVKAAACITAVGILIGAWQLLPTAELMTQTPRYHGGADSTMTGQMSLPPAWLPALWLHDVFGNAAEATFNQSNWPAYEWELSGFMGISIFVLALLAGFGTRRNRFFGGCVFVGFTLALGQYVPVNDLMSHLPVIGSFRAPVRWSIIAIWGICGLAASTIDRLCNAHSRRTGEPTVKIGRMYVFMLLFALLILWYYLNGLYLINSTMMRGLVETAGFLVIAIAAIALSRKISSHRVIYILPLLVFFELYWVQADYPAVGPPDIVLGTPAGYHLVEKSPGRCLSLVHESSRRIRQNWHRGWSLEGSGDYPDLRDAYPMYSGLIHRFSLLSFNEWSPLHYQAYRAWGNSAARLEQATIDNFSVRYVVTPPEVPLFRGNPVLALNEWEIRDLGKESTNQPQVVQPMASDGVALDNLETIRILNNLSGDSPVKVFADRMPRGIEYWSDTADVRYQAVSVNRGRLRMDAENWTCLHMHSVFDKGWRFDGGAEKSVAAKLNGLFLGVFVPPGTHDLILKYAPVSYKLGLFVSGITLLLVILAANSRDRRFVPAVPAGADGGEYSPGRSRRWTACMILLLLVNVSGCVSQWDMWLETMVNWLV